MDNFNRKMRNRILLCVLPVAIIVLVSLSAYNYLSLKENLLSNYEESKNTTEAHIVDTITLIDAGYRMLEVRLEAELNEKVRLFREEYDRVGGNVNAINLKDLQKRYGDHYDFMIIDSNTTITHATEPLAINFNFKAFDGELGNKIDGIRQGTDIWFEQLRTNVATGRLSKFAYIPTSDHRYLLEVGYSVNGFNTIIEELKPQSITDSLTQLNPLVASIRIFDTYGYQYVDSGVDFKPTPEILKLVKDAQKLKAFELDAGNNTVRKYIFVELNSKREKTLANTDRVIEITYNKNIISEKLAGLARISAGISLLLLVSLIFSIIHFSRKLTGPIESLKELSNEIAQGNYQVMAEIHTPDEVGDLAKSFNRMIADINSSFTEIERQKNALEDYNRNLEGKVAARTQEIASRNHELEGKNAELELAWARANEATALKSSFVAMISHEIRTPINGIIGMSYLMRRTQLTSRQKDYVSKMKSSADALLAIINDVLDMSKLEAGKATLEKISFDISEIFEFVSAQMAFKAAEKKLELVFYYNPAIPGPLIGDPFRLKQVITNLLNNAVKFTQKGEILVTADVIEESGEKIRLRFAVKDTGVGIEPNKIQKLFEPFQQADDSITREYGGTGLGLSICRQFINLMGGEIWVESEPGKGSTFSFTAEFSRNTDVNPFPEDDFAAVQDFRVLVVEPSQTTREALRKMILSCFSDLSMADSAEVALKLIEDAVKENRPFDVILIDEMMQGLEAVEDACLASEKARMKPGRGQLILTGYDLDEARREKQSTGVTGFLSKPVLWCSLIQLITDQARSHPPEEVDEIRKQQQSFELPHPSAEIRILLAEDNVINQQVICELLEHTQIAVDIAENGSLAIAAVADKGYDLILMDIQMPEMDGLEATRRIRAMPEGKEIPIVAMTAYALEEDRIAALEAGMNDYMSKPVNEAALYEMLAKWTQKKIVMGTAGSQVLESDELILKLKSFRIKSPLANLHGNRNLFIKLLAGFHSENKDAEQVLDQLISQGNAAEARAVVHRIRGVSGNLGAMELFITAQALEADLNKDQSKDSWDTYDAFKTELRRVLDEIDSVRDGTPYTEPVEIDDMNLLGMGALFSELKALLKEGSSEVELLIPPLNQLMVHTEYAHLSNALVDQINNYDFDEALLTIENIEKKM